MENNKKSLKNSKVFANRSVGSIPSTVFICLGALIIFSFLLALYYLGVVIAFIVSFIFAFIIFVPALIVHKNDPQGYITWLLVLFKANQLDTDSFQSKKLKIVSLDYDNPVYISLINYRKK